MFSVREKRTIADHVHAVLRNTKHPELPAGEIQFTLSVKGAEAWSFAEIKNNGAVPDPSVNVHNELQDVGLPVALQRRARVAGDWDVITTLGALFMEPGREKVHVDELLAIFDKHGYKDRVQTDPNLGGDCLGCGVAMPDFDPGHCCDGRECGCLGRPTNPQVCSAECQEKAYPTAEQEKS